MKRNIDVWSITYLSMSSQSTHKRIITYWIFSKCTYIFTFISNNLDTWFALFSIRAPSCWDDNTIQKKRRRSRVCVRDYAATSDVINQGEIIKPLTCSKWSTILERWRQNGLSYTQIMTKVMYRQIPISYNNFYKWQNHYYLPIPINVIASKEQFSLPDLFDYHR